METLKTFKVGLTTVKIMPDDGSTQECPLETFEGEKDPEVRFVTFEKRSSLSDYHDFSEPDEVKPWAAEHGFEAFILRKYDHGSVHWSTSQEYPFNCPWDSGQVGWVLVKRSAFPNHDWHEVAESWCKAVTTWANGWYYGYVIEDEDGNDLDSCWGFDDEAYCEEEARSTAKYHADILAEQAARQAEHDRPDMYT